MVRVSAQEGFYILDAPGPEAQYDTKPHTRGLHARTLERTNERHIGPHSGPATMDSRSPLITNTHGVVCVDRLVYSSMRRGMCVVVVRLETIRARAPSVRCRSCLPFREGASVTAIWAVAKAVLFSDSMCAAERLLADCCRTKISA